MKSLLLPLFSLCALAFAGCPQYMIEQAEKLIPPKGYKPRYMTSGVRLDTLAKQYAEKIRRGEIDSSNMYDDEEEIGKSLPPISSSGSSTQTDVPTSAPIDSSAAGSSTNRPSSTQQDTLYHATTGKATKNLSITITGRKKEKDSLLQALSSKSPISMQLRSLEDKGYPDQIEIRTTVFDTAGRFLMGLAPPNFKGTGTYRNYWRTLSDSCNGVKTEIDSFTVTEASENSREPHAIAFVIDHSGSMGETRILRLREAVKKTMNIISSGDMVSVIPFAGSVKVEVPLSGDSAEYKRRFNVESNAKVRGGTSIYDAVDIAVKEVMKAPAGYKRAIMLFTDGEDNTSKLNLADACRLAREKGVPVYAISYGVTDEEPLEKLTQRSGGRLYRIYSVKEFPYVFMDIYRSLKTYYVIRYTPPKCSGLHHVKFSLSLPELGIKRLTGRGMYDKSLFSDLDTVGTIAFINIEFETGKAEIRPESMPLLEQVATALTLNPSIEMEIRGHTDNRGNDELNLKLSRQRASAVATALSKLGISSQRLRTQGFGSTRPVVPNDNDENRAKNRRTEFVIIRK